MSSVVPMRRIPPCLTACWAPGLDVVAVGVPHEGAVVVGVVVGPDAGFVEYFGASTHRCLEEGPYRGPVGCRERDVRLAESLAAGQPADPEIWHGRDTEADG